VRNIPLSVGGSEPPPGGKGGDEGVTPLFFEQLHLEVRYGKKKAKAIKQFCSWSYGRQRKREKHSAPTRAKMISQQQQLI